MTLRSDDRPVRPVATSSVDRIARVASAVCDAARAAGRDPATVTIVAVTKTQPPRVVAAALAAGLRDVGENYVQEARDKRAAVGATATWHLIGALQRNKARWAARVFDRVHTLDALPVAEALDAAAGALGRRLPVLVQVRTGDEPARRGVPPEDLPALLRQLQRLRSLLVDGLMAMPPPRAQGDAAGAHFGAVRRLRDEVAREVGVELPHLSMGMSGDFPVAIAEGATMIRLGRELFGPRGPRPWRRDA